MKWQSIPESSYTYKGIPHGQGSLRRRLLESMGLQVQMWLSMLTHSGVFNYYFQIPLKCLLMHNLHHQASFKCTVS